MGYYKDQAVQKMIDPAKSRKGKNARQRGNAWERTVAAKINGTRTGQFGGQVDASSSVYDLQCKVGGSYPERIDGWLRKIPFRYDKLRGVVMGDSPGLGGTRRAVIIFDLDEWLDFAVPQEPPE